MHGRPFCALILPRAVLVVVVFGFCRLARLQLAVKLSF